MISTRHPSHTPLSLLLMVATTTIATAQWTTRVEDGVVLADFAGKPQLAMQLEPLSNPKAGESFLPSAFFHPMRTPSGFAWTAAQPHDHVHHLGVWWPWKNIKIDGKTYNCWELQNGEGAHHARSSNPISVTADAIEWEFQNEIRIRKPGEDAAPPVLDGITAIRETVRTRIARHGPDANVIDITIRQTAGEKPVTIEQYRYSGFAWRGPESWTHANSTMTTSSGLNRDQANGSEGRWVLVTGPTEGSATASVLLMSGAKDIAGTPEQLRVWNSGAHDGTPFVNFNPVQKAALPLNDDTPAVSHRQYRILAADRTLTAAEAETEWQAWRVYKK